MRILLLNLYYPPDTSATAKMAETVVKVLSDHQVTLLCGRPSYDPTARLEWRLYQTERDAGLRIVRVGSTDFPRLQMKRRVFNYLTYTVLVIPRALWEPCDVVLAMTDPPFEGIVGAFIAMLKGKPFVYNIRDMYPDMAVGGSIVAPGLLARVWEKLHRWALRRAERVIVLGEDMRNRIVGKGVCPERVEIVRDGVDLACSGGTRPLDDSVIARIRGNFRFVLLHAGNLGFYGAWSTLIEAARYLANRGIGLVFVGDGAQRRDVEAIAASTSNVRFLPFFAGDKVDSVLAAADLHVITVKRGLEGVVVPSKMYGILAAGKPILAVAPAETDAVSLGKKMGFGVGADPEQASDAAAAVLALVDAPDRVQEMGQAALAAAPLFSRANELRRFKEILERMPRD